MYLNIRSRQKLKATLFEKNGGIVFWGKKDDEEGVVGVGTGESPTHGAIFKSPELPAPVTQQAQSSTAPVDLKSTIDDRFGKARSALGAGTIIQGKLSFDTPVCIDGQLSGEIYSTKAVIVGESGRVDADIEVQSLVIMGKVKGTVKASERVEILSGGEMNGTITTSLLTIEDGARFNGQSSMTSKSSVVSLTKADKKTDVKDSSIESTEPRVH